MTRLIASVTLALVLVSVAAFYGSDRVDAGRTVGIETVTEAVSGTGTSSTTSASTAAGPVAAAPPQLAIPAEPIVLPKPTLPSASVGAMGHVWQSLNNCGPATVVMALSTFGISASQEDARLALRGADQRRGMGPQPVGPWVREQYGLRSVWRTNGTNALLKALVTNGFTPMVTQWLQDPTVSRISHWRAVRGYDDAKGAFYVNDPMLGANVPLGYGWFGANWQAFAYRYMVLYRPEDEPLLKAIIGDEWFERPMRLALYERAKAEVVSQRTSAAWLAYGEAAYQYGMFEEAIAAFERGLQLGSATGVFTLRSSYPQALAALGRTEEAQEMAAKLSNVSTVPAASSGPRPPDTFALWLAAERARPFDAPHFTEH